MNLNQAVQDTVSFVAHQLHLNQIELSIQLGDNIPVIWGSKGQLQQVFTNLVINAMHASPPGSEIEVSTRYSPALGEIAGNPSKARRRGDGG